MRIHERGDPIRRAIQREVVVEVIMPEHTGIALMREDVTVGQQFVVDDGTPFIAQVMILDEGHGGLRLLLQNGFPGGEVLQAETILIA